MDRGSVYITGAAGYTYIYDADSNRIEKTTGGSSPTGTIYFYASPGIVAESDLSGNLKSEYVFFDGERVARKDFPSGAVSYYFSDHLKTASVITDSAGNIKEDEDYYPWGGELQFVNSDSNHYKFTGKERDSETGLDYFGARYYGNSLGRWMSPDWATKPEAIPYSDLRDPQSLNLYGYVRNLPTTLVDKDGHGDAMTGYYQCQHNPTCRAQTDKGTVKGAMLETLAMGTWFGGGLFVAPEAVTLGGTMMIRLAPLATVTGAALVKARDAVTNAVQGLKNLSTSLVTTSRISGAINALRDHATNMDLKGVVREAAGVLKGNHAQEVGEVVDSLKNLRSSLQGALNNPNLSDEARTAYTQTIQQINNFVQKAQPIIDAAKKKMQGH
jgi:RHS repeat-associated protein